MPKPKYSKRAVRAAGEQAVKGGPSDDSICVINHWRRAHLAPMIAAVSAVSGALDNGVQYALAGRIKKIDTIIDKLSRDYITGNLSNMADVAGVRVVVPDMLSLKRVCSVVESLSAYSAKRSAGRNYISYPKSDGYRGRHYVLVFDNLDFGYESLFVELQVRTDLQHQWATAVEMYDAAAGSRLKFGESCNPAAGFFSRMSKLIRLHEEQGNFEGLDSLIRSISGSDRALREALGTVEVLRAASNGFSLIGNEPDDVLNRYVLVELDHEMQTITAAGYDGDEGIARYFESESERPEIDSLLVRAASMDLVKRMYPNYFGDMSAFLKLFDRHMPAFA